MTAVVIRERRQANSTRPSPLSVPLTVPLTLALTLALTLTLTLSLTLALALTVGGRQTSRVPYPSLSPTLTP